jgi:hypothetical protein
LQDNVEGIDELGDRLHGWIVWGDDSVACGKPFKEGETERRPAQSTGEPENGSTRAEAVIAPDCIVGDDFLSEPIRKVVHLLQNRHHSSSLKSFIQNFLFDFENEDMQSPV